MQSPELKAAIALIREHGGRVSFPKPKTPTRVSPTFVATFKDGTVTRMTTYSLDTNLDWKRGEAVAKAAYASRHKLKWPYREPMSPIIAAHWERDGVVIAERKEAA